MSNAVKTIFLHGFSGDRTGLKPLADSLGMADSYLIDLPSFGNNHREYEPNWRSYVTAVLETIKDEAGAGPYRLIGHSHGAMVAYALATYYPADVAELVLICPVGYSTKIGRAFISANTALGRAVGYDRAAKLQQLTPLVDVVTRASKQSDWPEDQYNQFKQARRNESRHYNGKMLQLLEMVQQFTGELDASSVKTRTLIVQASRDLLVSPRDIDWYMSRLTSAKLAYCRGGHVAPAIFPQEMAGIIRQNVHINGQNDL